MSAKAPAAHSPSSSSVTARDSSPSPFAAPDGNPQPLRSNGRPISRSRPSTSNSALSTSVNQRQPARSFVTHSMVQTMDPAHYSSHGVREQTAELASFAFAEPGSFNTVISQRPRAESVPAHNAQNYGKSNTNDDSRHPSPAAMPDIIQEVSEPVTPESTQPSSPNSSNMSNIAKLLRSKQNSPEEEVHVRRRPSTDESNHEENVNGNITAVPEVIINQTDGSDERTPLLQKNAQPDTHRLADENGPGDIEGGTKSHKKQKTIFQLTNEVRRRAGKFVQTATNPKTWSGKVLWEKGVKEPVALLPCVFLGVLLNVLDALSYGMILFPLGEPIFAKTGPDGISMFYVSCIVAQLIYSSGGSIFKGAVGSEMIEVVPFFHKMTYTIMAEVGTDKPHVVMATVITAFAMSSVITGMVFLILGSFQLGSLVNFFPRHILIGCIGGVGFFLFVTGIEVSARLEGNLEYNFATLKQLFRSDTVYLWVIPLVLSVVLLAGRRVSHSPYLVPGFFISIAAIFYIVVAAVPSLDVPKMRDAGWIFSAVDSNVPFYNFYSYYDFKIVDWGALFSTVPAMFALTFFGILHVPINIPALAIAAQEDDLNLNRELVAHGFSNAISGFCGSIQNYLAYVNSEMFISNGGNSRLAGFLLAGATFGVWVAGPAMIGFVPIMVVGALIFYLGIALLEEALYDTLGKMNRLEYLTVLTIVLIMGIYDFVAGIVAGIILACLNFVVQTSRKSAIRATYSGEFVESTVRRHPIQRRFLHEVGYQIYVTKLAGYLFFGSIVRVEKQSRALIEEEAFRKEPIRFLVFDLAHVNGIDFSAAEAFTRMERILGRRDVRMIISGIDQDHEVGKSFRNVGLWQNETSVEFFENLNTALEYCENELLKEFYRQRDAMDSAENSRQHSFTIPKQEHNAHLSAAEPLTNLDTASPRQQTLVRAANTTLNTTTPQPKKWTSFKQPLPLLLQTFRDLSSKTEDFWFRAVPFFTREEYTAGTTLFRRGERSDGFFLLETGILHADYSLPVGQYHESIVAGTTCGELPFFSESARTATVFAEKDCVTWCLSAKEWERMQGEWPQGASELLRIALKLTKERVDAVTGYVLTTAG